MHSHSFAHGLVTLTYFTERTKERDADVNINLETKGKVLHQYGFAKLSIDHNLKLKVEKMRLGFVTMHWVENHQYKPTDLSSKIYFLKFVSALHR